MPLGFSGPESTRPVRLCTLVWPVNAEPRSPVICLGVPHPDTNGRTRNTEAVWGQQGLSWEEPGAQVLCTTREKWLLCSLQCDVSSNEATCEQAASCTRPQLQVRQACHPVYTGPVGAPCPQRDVRWLTNRTAFQGQGSTISSL